MSRLRTWFAFLSFSRRLIRLWWIAVFLAAWLPQADAMVLPLYTSGGDLAAVSSPVLPTTKTETWIRVYVYENENPYNGVFCYVQSPLGLDPSDPEFGVKWGLSLGFDTRGIYLDSLDFGAAVRQRFESEWEWEIGLYQRLQLGRSPGTPVDHGGFGADVVGISASLTHGEGSDRGIAQYSVNGMTVSPFLNTFGKSVTWGQTLNWNLTEDLDNDLNVNLAGFLQWRNRGTSFYYANDVDMPPNFIGMAAGMFGLKSTDRYWTAEALLGLVDSEGGSSELAWQCFTGDIIDRDRRLAGNVYDQTPAQEDLNRSEWSLRYAPVGRPWQATIGRSSSKILNPQDWVHAFNNLELAKNGIINPLRWLIGLQPLPPSEPPPCGYFYFKGYDNPRTFITIGTQCPPFE